MPGLNQLKEFSNDIREVGDEVKIRAQRGEKPVEVPIPEGISEEDDSDAFLLGMPELDAADDSAENDENDSPSVDMGATVDVPDLDSILSPQTSDADFDVSAFMADIDNPVAGNPVPEAPAAAEETPLEDLDLESLLSSASAPEEPAVPDFPEVSEAPSADVSDDLLAGLSDPGDFGGLTGGDTSAAGDDILKDFGDISEAPSASSDTDFSLDDLDSLAGSLDSLDGLDSAGSGDGASADSADLSSDAGDLDSLAADVLSDEPAAGSSDVLENFDADSLASEMSSDEPAELSDLTDSGDLNADFEKSGEPIDMNSDLPEEILMEDGVGLSETPEDSAAPSEPSADDFSMDEPSGGADEALLANFSDDLDQPASSAQSDGASDFDFDADALSSEPASDSGSETPSDSSFDFDTSALDDFSSMDSSPAGDFDTSALDSFDGGNGEVPDASLEVPGDDSFSTEFSAGDFDTSEMDGLDFGESSAPSASSADEFPVTGEGPQRDVDDFELDSDFTIPGFSDTETADLSKKNLDTVDFSKGKSAKPKNTLTDEEYQQFRKNLASYPLNLRLAVEDLIVKNEFTDDAVFEVIEKILKKSSARQVATHVEKMMDITINIPRDYERRSYAQYEAYKQSFQYQLKNRIIPAAIAGIILCFVCFGLFKASVKFIYKPVMASMNYKQGYVLLENNEFPQSEDKFKEAVSYRPVKKWFFKYANGYREKKQFDRAADMYRKTLRYFNHDLNAGVEYAQMELFDRANYQRAEEIVRREILDYHINNPEGMLLLGDVFLEWAEVDDSKYELAKNQYVELIQRFGETNVYLSRMLRFYIRTDKLREVLVYKNIFFPNAKSLSASDWTELSGYLLDKLYGNLSRNDEYLRSSIEDIRAMLEIAVRSNTLNPVAHYNLAKYFVNTGYTEQAKAELERSIDLFDEASIRTKKNVYREINATRVLGELYAGNKEYLKAQTVYTRGVDLYNEEHESTGLEGDENTGKLFADLGDIDYFISGELDSALFNYEKAIEIKNDTPSINYRVGAIYYGKELYDNALDCFNKVAESESKDCNVLLALGNTLALRGDNIIAQSYYEDLLKTLDMEKAKRKLLLPQEDPDEANIVDLYLKANNNLGVALYKDARQSGNSQKNAEAMVRLSESMRAWDALTRNYRTLVRMEGSNLAAQNSKYITHPRAEFEPAIYTDIPKILSDEKNLE